ncbi:MAG: hypothetical protein K8U03_03415 [Planctomycetia bacterium]|nr:hypothetical protein [Planctomycetia bacterium]
MHDATVKPRRFRFSLRTMILWIFPYIGICFVILTAFREPIIDPGEALPMFHWVRLSAIGIFTAVLIALFREDRRARRLQAGR